MTRMPGSCRQRHTSHAGRPASHGPRRRSAILALDRARGRGTRPESPPHGKRKRSITCQPGDRRNPPLWDDPSSQGDTNSRSLPEPSIAANSTVVDGLGLRPAGRPAPNKRRRPRLQGATKPERGPGPTRPRPRPTFQRAIPWGKRFPPPRAERNRLFATDTNLYNRIEKRGNHGPHGPRGPENSTIVLRSCPWGLCVPVVHCFLNLESGAASPR